MGCNISRRRKHQFSEIRKFSKLNIHKFYRFGRVLGSGSFGTVKLAYSLEQERNGQQSKVYAIKSIDKSRMGNKFHLIQRELEILAQLDHPNIIRVYEVYEDQRYYHFVMEYCKGGELFERVIRKGVYSERKTQVIMKQLFSAVQHMHDLGIIHRDLKPENLMLVSPDDDFNLKIIDFGLSKKYPPPANTFEGRSKVRQQTRVGTPIYVAPEVISGVYSQTCDEWSLGCIMYVLLSGEPPFFSHISRTLEQKILQDKVQFKESAWKNISQEAKELIMKLLDKNPKRRITCAQSLQSSWIKKFDKDFALEKRTTTQSKQEDIPLGDETTLKLLKTYGNISKMKKETLKILLNQLNENQIEGLRIKFEEFDKDHSGTISIVEIIQIMKEQGLNETEKEIKDMMKKLAIQGQQQKQQVIYYSDFLVALLNQQQYLNEERLWMLFKQFDSDDKNYITKIDVKRVLERRGRQLSVQKLESIFSEIDSHHNGFIGFEEFCKIMLADLEGTSQQQKSQLEQQRSQLEETTNSSYLRQPKGDSNLDINFL